MKFNRIIFIGLMTAIILSFTGCIFNNEHKYVFDQSFENIVSVEIRELEYKSNSTTPYKTRVIKTIDEESTKVLLSDISEAEFSDIWGDNLGGNCGKIVVYITYSDGICEVIGIYNCAIIDKNGKWRLQEKKFSDYTVFLDLIYKHIDKSLYGPDLPNYPPATFPPSS